MRLKRFFTVLLMCSMMVLLANSQAAADIPKLINYQGMLTTNSGEPLNGTFDVFFRIYNAPSGGDKRWEENHAVVSVSDGVFSVILGSQSGGMDLDFSEDYWLEVEVEGDTIAPRRQLTSTGYAYRSLVADSAIVAGSSEEVNCHDCDTVFVNVVGPDSVVATTGSAFLGKVSGSSTGPLYGVTGSMKNTASGGGYGGYFTTSSEGTGERCGLKAEGYGASSSDVHGIEGHAANTSSGYAVGGFFTTSSSGTGEHYGVSAYGQSNSNDDTYGIEGWALNYSSGEAYGGYFRAPEEGSGERYGVRAYGASNSSSSAYGTYGTSGNYSSGNAYGGYFRVDAGGSGTHYGVYGTEQAGGTGAAVYAAGDFGGSGGKYAVMKTSKGHRLLSVIESPEVWFEDFGDGRLENGRTHIELDALFLETVTINADHPMKVFVQLEGDCNGVFVTKGTTGFDVNELKSGTSNTVFSYRVVAKRKGYETERLRETDVGYDDPNLYPQLKAKREKEREIKETE